MRSKTVLKLAPCLLVTTALCLGTLRLSAQAPATGVPIIPAGLSSNALNEISALLQEKAARTPAQKRMDSQLVHALKHNRGEAFAPGAPNVQMDVKMEADGRVLVDINATVTPELLSLIQAGGGQVMTSVPQFRSIRALVTLTQLETLAGSTNVNYIRRASEAYTNKTDSEGDTTHQAIQARSTFGVNGSGIKVGVLSDSVDYYTNLQAAGDLPAINILSGQSGLGSKQTGEGTAMLELVNDLAPGATLYFATANGGDAQFAYNILNLWTNGCKIITDDEDYFDESPFQDGIIAQAVNTVTANGVLYFSAAINSGNLDDGTSGTWEGDFVDGGSTGGAISEVGRVHSFGSATYDTCAPGGSQKRVDLFWSDPLGASDNDYDLFVLDATGSTVVESSTAFQTGTQDPYESVGALTNGNRIVIVKYMGAGRFLHLSTGRAVLSIATSGSTRGHPAAANAFGVAAINENSAYPNAFTGGSTNPFESFSSDGLRHMFFNADGSAITPGNFSSSGGAIRQKPDIAAADHVSTDVTGFQPFSGTSAAAPHAAAIAALLWSYKPSLTTAQIRTVLTGTALDEDPAGVDRDTGYGIVMAYQALDAVALSPSGNVWVDFNYSGPPNNGAYFSPFSTLAAGVSAVSSGGTIWIRTAGSSAETMTISKPMTIHAYDGAATIGH
jgi:hypothetical protein